MNNNNIAVIILAAGMGKRMKSQKAKVLHKVLGKPMIIHVTKTAGKIAGDNIIVVVGHQAETVRKTVAEKYEAIFAYQEKQLGTGHAVMCALPYLSDHVKDVVILYGDVPLLTSETVMLLISEHKNNDNDITVLTVELNNPTGYGRVLFGENGNVLKIVEEADANSDEKKIKIINSGIYCVKKDYLKVSLKKIKSDNAQKELYLTDIIEIGNQDRKKVGKIIIDNSNEVIGVNSYQDLQATERLVRDR